MVIFHSYVSLPEGIPSGKHTKCYGKSTSLMGSVWVSHLLAFSPAEPPGWPWNKTKRINPPLNFYEPFIHIDNYWCQSLGLNNLFKSQVTGPFLWMIFVPEEWTTQTKTCVGAAWHSRFGASMAVHLALLSALPNVFYERLLKALLWWGLYQVMGFCGFGDIRNYFGFYFFFFWNSNHQRFFLIIMSFRVCTYIYIYIHKHIKLAK